MFVRIEVNRPPTSVTSEATTISVDSVFTVGATSGAICVKVAIEPRLPEMKLLKFCFNIISKVFKVCNKI